MIQSLETYFTQGCGRCEKFAKPACKVQSWRAELAKLRSILQGTELTEELKWSKPCYTWQGANVVMICAFKDYCALAFFKGSLLQDLDGILTSPGESSQAARQIRFTRLAEIEQLAPQINVCIQQAIEVEKAGRKVEFKKNLEPIPEQLQTRLDADAKLREAFFSLTPGRQRA